MKILILSNFDDDYKIEDLFIARAFEKDGHEVTITTINYSEELEEIYDIIIRRNTWFDDEKKVEWYQQLMHKIANRIKEKEKLSINFNGIFDTNNKNYLVDLYNDGYKVIPTIKPNDNFEILPNAPFYLLKPLDSYDGIGQIKVAKEEIKKYLNNPEYSQYIIQPYIEKISEIEFHFVKDKLEYALRYMPNKLDDNAIVEEYNYSNMKADMATTFAKLNPSFIGAQRIDFLETTNEDLLLLEIEDAAPFLSLQYINEEKRKQFIDDYKEMVYTYYKKNSTK